MLSTNTLCDWKAGYSNIPSCMVDACIMHIYVYSCKSMAKPWMGEELESQPYQTYVTVSLPSKVQELEDRESKAAGILSPFHGSNLLALSRASVYRSFLL